MKFDLFADAARKHKIEALLKYLNNLSDEQVEYQLLDRMSYQRFCLLTNSATIPEQHHLALPAASGRRRRDSAVPGSGRAATAPRVHGTLRTND